MSAALTRIHEVINLCVAADTSLPHEIVDVHFMRIAVSLDASAQLRDELLALIGQIEWAQPLADGPSYIAMGADLGDQCQALKLLAIGQAMKLWKVITPATFGFHGAEAQQLAGGGMVMCDGLRSEA